MIERCFDYRRIKKFPAWHVLISDEVYYLMEIKCGKDLGLWTFHPWFDGLLIHANVGDECRGRDAVASAKDAFKWIFENTGCRKIYAAIPNDKRPAQFVASWAGMTWQYNDETKRYYKIEWGEVMAPQFRKAG